MDLMAEMKPAVEQYLRTANLSRVPELAGRRFIVEPLAKGEYNLNYRITSEDDFRLVFRVNIDTQIGRDDQIIYEYKALRLLAKSGYTPIPYHVDDTRRFIEQGILVMEYLTGEPLDYRRDLNAAARLLAGIHRVPVPDAYNHLIREEAPLTLIFEECAGLLSAYFTSDLADPEIREYLQDVLAWAEDARHRERHYQADPWNCIVNTEVNANNFIVDRNGNTIKLVDWEMPRYGDPSSDISHFCSPLTTLWKTDYRMDPATKHDFINTYAFAVEDEHLKSTIHDRVQLKDPFVYLRGISWSAMGWIRYQTGFSGVKNPDTWETLNRYMNLDFIRELFDPVMAGE
jgi:aminoglycoside phosphotransferase (APT) family kinase protein